MEPRICGSAEERDGFFGKELQDTQGSHPMTEEQIEIDLDYLAIIESQLNVLASVIEFPDDMYDEVMQSKIKTASLSFRIINKVQQNLLKAL